VTERGEARFGAVRAQAPGQSPVEMQPEAGQDDDASFACAGAAGAA